MGENRFNFAYTHDKTDIQRALMNRVIVYYLNRNMQYDSRFCDVTFRSNMSAISNVHDGFRSHYGESGHRQDTKKTFDYKKKSITLKQHSLDKHLFRFTT